MKDYQRQYKKRIVKLQIDLFPTDEDIISWLKTKKPLATYIKAIIREDIKKSKLEK